MAETPTNRLDGRKVLIVDDDPDVLAVVEQALKAEGALTRCCSDGNSAVAVCENESPELVVLDMMLPRRSGFLVLERIKAGKGNPAVIMITANEGKRHQAYAESLGVDAYLHKPVRLERLVTLASDLLSGKPVEEKKAD